MCVECAAPAPPAPAPPRHRPPILIHSPPRSQPPRARARIPLLGRIDRERESAVATISPAAASEAALRHIAAIEQRGARVRQPRPGEHCQQPRRRAETPPRARPRGGPHPTIHPMNARAMQRAGGGGRPPPASASRRWSTIHPSTVGGESFVASKSAGRRPTARDGAAPIRVSRATCRSSPRRQTAPPAAPPAGPEAVRRAAVLHLPRRRARLRARAGGGLRCRGRGVLPGAAARARVAGRGGAPVSRSRRRRALPRLQPAPPAPPVGGCGVCVDARRSAAVPSRWRAARAVAAAALDRGSAGALPRGSSGGKGPLPTRR